MGIFACQSWAEYLAKDGNPIEMTSNHITVDQSGNIYEVPLKGLKTDEDNADTEAEEPTLLGKIGVVNFDDETQLVKGDNGTFTSQAEAKAVDGGLMWKSVERSNIDPIEQMTSMMTSQRASQSAAQVLKMYDQLMGKIVTDIGRV